MGVGIVDIVGTSQEYGYNCIKELVVRVAQFHFLGSSTVGHDWHMNMFNICDGRVWIVVGVALFFVVLLVRFQSLFLNRNGSSKAEDIDGDYGDVNYQFGYIYFQQEEYYLPTSYFASVCLLA